MDVVDIPYLDVLEGELLYLHPRCAVAVNVDCDEGGAVSATPLMVRVRREASSDVSVAVFAMQFAEMDEDDDDN